MTSLFSSTPHPPSRLSYPHLNHMWDFLLSAPTSSTATTFTLPTSTVTLTSLSANTMSSSSPQPSISSVLPTAKQSSASSPPPLLPHDAVASSAHLQHCCAVRQVTRNQFATTKAHIKRPQLPPDEAGSPYKRIIVMAVYKQKVTQYNMLLNFMNNKSINSFWSKRPNLPNL